MAKTTVKMSKVGGILLLNFKIYFQATVNQEIVLLVSRQNGMIREQNRRYGTEPRNRPIHMETTDF